MIKQTILLEHELSEEIIRAYIAGLFDGEGSVYIRNYNSENFIKIHGEASKSFGIGIAMCEKEIIDFIYTQLKKDNIDVCRHTYQPKGKDTYKLQFFIQINGDNSVKKFFDIYSPYLKRLNKNYEKLLQK